MPVTVYEVVNASIWSALVDPTRRAVLNLLRERPRSVGELVEALGLSQPTTSKHLRVLREVGAVSVMNDAQRRVYSIDPEPFLALDAWLDPFRRLWCEQFDALGDQLDSVRET